MKQHITLKQWKELDREQQKISIRALDIDYNPDLIPNIGQMIEFLGDDFLSLHIDDDVFFVDTIDKSFYGAEPIIPLWEAFKYKLKNTP